MPIRESTILEENALVLSSNIAWDNMRGMTPLYILMQEMREEWSGSRVAGDFQLFQTFFKEGS